MSEPLDSLGFFAAARRVPEQAEAALLAAQDSPLPDVGDPDAIVVVGAGASGWSAEVVAATAAPVSPLPVVVESSGALPAFVSGATVVLALSLHGEESETLATAAAAAAAGAQLVVIAAGGTLTQRAADWGAATVTVDGSIPHARAALGALVTAPLVVLDRLGLVPGTELALDRAIAQLHRRRTDLFDAVAGGDVDAPRLARRIGRSIPVIYGAGTVGLLAARRWKQQCNANAKIPAFSAALPGLAHDEISGWGQHGDVTRQVLSAVLLHHDLEPVSGEPFTQLLEILDESVGAVHEVKASGEGALAQLLDLAYIGDVVSLYLAAQEGLDPGPAPALDLLPGRAVR
ncbi:MAG TPA: SIS domain-containing protein [Acidimicrobiales bacterium]|jgi:glucose/mannose-6-phosphate isomerase|nr:SIS domain-containing protein [Acidimicrobiales bacterium]